MPHPNRTWITTVAKANLVLLILIALILSSGSRAAGIPGSDVPYGIEPSNDIQVGIGYFHQGKLEDAIRVFSRIIENKPEGPETDEVYALLGYAYLCRGWNAEAEKAYSEALRQTSDPALRFRALLALGQLQLDNGNHDKAVSLFNDALRASVGQDKAITYTLLGIANYEAGKTAPAREMFDKALNIFPDDPVPDYYIQLIEYDVKKKSVLFPKKPQLGRKGIAGKKADTKTSNLGGVVSINSGAKYTLTPHIKLTLGTKTKIPPEGFFISAGDDSFRWHDWQSTNIEWRLRGDEDGVKKVSVVYYAEDFLATSIAEASIALDRRPPWGSFEINQGDKYANNAFVNLNFSTYDKLSGVTGVCLSNDGRIWTDWMTYRSTLHNWQLTPGDGTKKVYARVHDGAGNISRVFSATVQLDTTPPQLWFINVKHLNPTSVEITWMTDEDCDSAVEFRLDGDKKQTITISDDKFTTFHVIYLKDLTPSTKYRFKALSRDLAGNLSASREYSFVTKASE